MRNAVRFPHLMTAAPLLRDLDNGFKDSFLEACLVRQYGRGDTVLAQGGPVEGMYLIAHGAVEITSFNPDGQTVLIHLHQRGENFGEIEAYGDIPAAANCTAADNAVLLFAPKSLLFSALREPVFVRNVFRACCDRLVRDNTTKFVDQFYPVEQRLCDYLYRLSVDKPEVTKTQADLAGLLGCARQTLNRELGGLRDQGVIEMRKGKIVVLDRPALLTRATAAHEVG
jgi:CRP/FNR family cyclic AMP-dependent transcriptional regulator